MAGQGTHTELSPIVVQYNQSAPVTWIFTPAWNGQAFGAITSAAGEFFGPTGTSLGAPDTVATGTDGDAITVVVTHDYSGSDFALNTNYRLEIKIVGTLGGAAETPQAVTQNHFFDVVAYPLDACVSRADIVSVYPEWQYNQRIDDNDEAGGLIRMAHSDLYYKLKNAGYTPSTLVNRDLYRKALLHLSAAKGFEFESPEYRDAMNGFNVAWFGLETALRTFEEENPENITTISAASVLRRG